MCSCPLFNFIKYHFHSFGLVNEFYSNFYIQIREYYSSERQDIIWTHICNSTTKFTAKDECCYWMLNTKIYLYPQQRTHLIGERMRKFSCLHMGQNVLIGVKGYIINKRTNFAVKDNKFSLHWYKYSWKHWAYKTQT